MEGWTKWKNLFFFIGVPALIASHFTAFVFVDPEEHKRPEFVPYEYMRIRTKVRHCHSHCLSDSN